MSCEVELIVDNSIYVQHVLTNPTQDPIYVNDATVTVTIKDSNGDNVAGETWPVDMDYVAASDGIYRATLAPNSNIEVDSIYTIEIDATGNGDGLVGKWEHSVKAKKRSG